MATFTQTQVLKLLETIDTGSAEEYRDMVIILMLLDTGLRTLELTVLRLCHVYLEDGLVKALGKGNREWMWSPWAGR